MSGDSRYETTRTFEEISASIDSHLVTLWELLREIERRLPEPEQNGE